MPGHSDLNNNVNCLFIRQGHSDPPLATTREVYNLNDYIPLFYYTLFFAFMKYFNTRPEQIVKENNRKNQYI